jgi:hypothetical protein
VPRFGGGGNRPSEIVGAGLATAGCVPGFNDRSGRAADEFRGGGGLGGTFFDSSDGLGGGARITCRGGGVGPTSSIVSCTTGPPNPKERASRAGWIFEAVDCGAGAGICCGGLLICSETCLGVGFTGANPSDRGSRDVGRSETVLALDGADPTTASRLGGLGSGFANPSVRGSRMGAVTVRVKPIDRGSVVFGGVIAGSGLSRLKFLSESEMSCPVGGITGEPGLSSLSGGVEKGDNLASDEGRRGATGCRVAASGTGSIDCGIVAGFAGILGLSALLTGGGGFARLVGGTDACIDSG